MARLTLAALGALLAAAAHAQPGPEPKADAWGEVRVTPGRTPAVDFAVAPGNREVAFYGYGKSYHLYDIAAEKVRREVVCEDSVNDLSYSPDGKQVATAAWTKGLQVRDARTGRVSATLKPDPTVGVSSSRFLPGGKLAAYCYAPAGGPVGTHRTQLVLWDRAGGRLLGWPPTETPEGQGDMTRSRFVTGNNLLAVETRRQQGYVTQMLVTITDALTNKTSPECRLSMNDYVLDASPDGKALLVFNPNRPPRLVEVATGRCTRLLVGGHRGAVTCGAFSPDGKHIATASGTQFRTNVQAQVSMRGGGSEIVVWDAATGKPVAVCSEPVPAPGYTNLKFSPDGKLIAASAGRADEPGGQPERKGDKLVLWGKVTTDIPGRDPSDRFRDGGDHLEDLQTGLLWQKDGSASVRVDYYGAIRYATGLQLGGQAGWRLPTPEELAGIYPATDKPFTNTKFDAERPKRGERADYWTSAIDPAKPDAAMVYPWTPGGKPTSTSASQTLSFARCVHDPVKK